MEHRPDSMDNFSKKNLIKYKKYQDEDIINEKEELINNSLFIHQMGIEKTHLFQTLYSL